jgi:predicted permease
MLSTSDKWLMGLFTLVLISSGLAVGWLMFVYANSFLLNDLDKMGARKNVSLTGALLFLGGIALGYSLVLVVCGALSRRYVAASTHQRWAEAFDPASLAARRYQGIFNLIRIALIPKQHRTPP